MKGTSRMPLVVSVDGPSASGKSWVSDELARRLEAVVLHSGLGYRAVTLHLIRAGRGVGRAEVEQLLRETKLCLDAAGHLHIGEECYATSEVETKIVDHHVSVVAAVEGLRRELLKLQRGWVARRIREGCHVVVEGRDAGTRIVPRAKVKIYLEATAAARAARRAAQRDAADGSGADEAAIRRRDEADRGLGRATAESPGVSVVRTDGKSKDEVLAEVLGVVAQKRQ